MHLARASHLPRGWSCMPGSSSGAAFAITLSFATAWVQVSQTHHPGLAAQPANISFRVLTPGLCASLQTK